MWGGVGGGQILTLILHGQEGGGVNFVLGENKFCLGQLKVVTDQANPSRPHPPIAEETPSLAWSVTAFL